MSIIWNSNKTSIIRNTINSIISNTISNQISIAIGCNPNGSEITSMDSNTISILICNRYISYEVITISTATLL